MHLSEVAFALVVLLCTGGFLYVLTKLQQNVDEETAKLRKQIHELEADFLALADKVSEQESQLNKFVQEAEERADTIKKQEDEIRRWNEGISNIMNYSLDVAKGGDK